MDDEVLQRPELGDHEKSAAAAGPIARPGLGQDHDGRRLHRVSRLWGFSNLQPRFPAIIVNGLLAPRDGKVPFDAGVHHMATAAGSKQSPRLAATARREYEDRVTVHERQR